MTDVTDTLRRGWVSLLYTPIEEAVRPPDATSVHAAGPFPYRLLLIGGGAAVGLGVSRHDRALPGHLARHLASITGRGVDLNLAVRLGMTVADARNEIDRWDLAGYDAIVLTLATADALASLPLNVWRHRLELLLAELLDKTSADARILAIGAHESSWSPYLHPRVTRAAAQRLSDFNRICRELCWSAPSTSYLAPLGRRASDRAHYSVLDYDRLGRTAAAHLADRLVRRSGAAAAPGASGAAPSPFSLAVRRLLGLTLDDAIGRVVARTRAAFGVDRATVSMLETSDPDASHLRRSEEDPQGPLTVAAARAGGLAVTDLRADPRFRDSPLACRHGMRFYAGHPIYASTGEPTAVLAIFDPRPRTFSPQEMSVLRNHALLIQHLLTAGGRPPARHAVAPAGSPAAHRRPWAVTAP